MLAVAGHARPHARRPVASTWPTPDNRRRTLYGAVSRHDLDPLLRLFDFPDPNITSDERTGDDRAAAAAVRAQQRVHGPQRQGAGRPRAGRLRRGRRATGSGRPSGCSTAGPPTDARGRSSAWRSSRPPSRRRDDERLTRWEQYAQVLLAAQRIRCSSIDRVANRATAPSHAIRPSGVCDDSTDPRRPVPPRGARPHRRRLRRARPGRRLRRRRAAGRRGRRGRRRPTRWPPSRRTSRRGPSASSSCS